MAALVQGTAKDLDEGHDEPLDTITIVSIVVSVVVLVVAFTWSMGVYARRAHIYDRVYEAELGWSSGCIQSCRGPDPVR